MQKVVFLIMCCAVFVYGCSDENTPPTNPDAPVLLAIGDKTVTSGDTLSFTISATDPNNLSLTYDTDGSVGSGANPYVGTGNLASFNSTSRLFSWNTTGVTTGDYHVDFSVMNSAGHPDNETIRIRIQSTPPTGQFQIGQSLYNNDCNRSGCHHDEDAHSFNGQFSVLCSIETTIKSATESGPGSMPSFNYTADQEAAISFYLNNVRPEDC